MSVYMASFGYELLAALEALLDMFDDGEGGGDRMATISPEYLAELQALITRGRGGTDA
jgi:hypothetical protein